jgi:hypothetical protein
MACFIAARPIASMHASLFALVLLAGAPPSASATPIFRSGFETLPCQGLECFQVDCQPAGTTTRITGRVFAPNGTLPLPNVQVFIPNAELEALPDGVQCARCDIPPSGSPLVLAHTAADGSFVLEDAPATTGVPIVIQSGKWRSRFELPAVAACAQTPVADGTLRFARDSSEGDMPKIALSTGAADAQECLLRKAGIADGEFTPSTGNGRVHLFAGSGGTDAIDAANGGENLTVSSATLWSTLQQLSGYDLVVLSCEGGPNATSKPATAREAMKDYVDIGGRAMIGHWHNIWIEQGPTPWTTLATWANLADLPPTTMDIATGFARGDELAGWVVAAGASAMPGTVHIVSPQHTATGVDAARARKRIFKDATDGGPTVQYFSFTTPVEDPIDARCGRVAFSELHASGGDSSSASLAFPSGGCNTPVGSLSPEEKTAIYVLFDLMACVDDAIE